MNLEELAIDLQDMKIRNNYWYPFMKKYGCQYICELGIYKGDNFLQMIKGQPARAVAVDAWLDNGVHPRRFDEYNQQQFNQQYELFRERVKNFSFVEIIRDYTYNAVTRFTDNYFDLVYLDADHSFEGCYRDLVTWYPKIKTNKFFTGHDYGNRLKKTFGVFNAVNKFAKENDLEIMRFGHSNWLIVKR